MLKKVSHSVLLILIFILSSLTKVYSQDDNTTAETVVHLLSYVAMDYPGAVQGGQIINEPEYREQQEFSAQALDLTKSSSFVSEGLKEKLLAQMQELVKSVDSKQPAEEISSIAHKINDKIIKETGIQTAPKIWPTLANGKQLYQQNCAICHGTNGKGDGPAGKALDPTPSNFHDIETMENFSPFQAYNSIRLGVPGTGMQAYSEFNEVELWDLAFYVKSLRFQDKSKDTLLVRKEFQEIIPKIGLADVANLTDNQLLDTIKSIASDNAEIKLSALRSLQPIGENAGNSLPTAKKGLQNALESYTDGNKKLARTEAISAYLEGIEPVEARLRTIDAKFVTQLENQMFKVRQAIEKDYGTETLHSEVSKADALIEQANELLRGHKLNYWLTFLISASIVLREALEAFLILAVVIALIRSSNAKKALPWLHGGWITALLCGVAGWYLSDYIIQFGGKNREIMEGLVSLFAVVVLIFAGFWLHNKTYAQKWTAFVEDKIGGYLKKDRMFGLAAFAFMVVFREAFEVILFLQAINLEAGPQNKSAIGFGTLAAFVAIGIIAYIFLKYTKKIPIRYIFKYSSWLIVFLAIILMGKGFHSLQESGWVSVTNLPSSFRLEWLGVYPTLQTIVAQLALITVIVVTYFINKRRNEKALQKA